MTSREPPMQNIPIRTEIGRQIRRGFIGPEGIWHSLDFGSVERRLLERLVRR